jgi:hypothetical protein
LRDDGIHHAGNTDVQAEPGDSLHLVRDVEVRDGAAKESEIPGIFERDGFGVRKRNPARVLNE